MELLEFAMHMDGLKKLTPKIEVTEIAPQKASFLSLPLKHKFVTLIALVSLAVWSFPHTTFASEAPKGSTSGALVFVIGDKMVYLDKVFNFQLSQLYNKQQMDQEIDRQLELSNKLKAYLQENGSPLAAYSSTLIQLSNWKKIIALSNAESGMCKHYPTNKSNCWGIGGANLWYMGSNLGEGILSMNRFLNTYPANSKVKYSQMTFRQMNGLYKQPPAQHWVDNNQAIYNDLTAIENSL